MKRKTLPKELRALVSWTVALLGRSIKETYGDEFYLKIENMREHLRDNWSGSHKDWQDDLAILRNEYAQLEALSEDEKSAFAHCNTCMLELFNRCEAAYRSYRLGQNQGLIKAKKDHSIIFVLTAHPTEARGPEFLSVFARIGDLLEESLVNKSKDNEASIFHLLQIILKVPLARGEKPEVVDEAKNIYDFTLKKDILSLLIKIRQQGTNVMLRTWAGGDKDGHPGVDEKTMLESLTLSRSSLLLFISDRLGEVEYELAVMKDLPGRESLLNEVKSILATIRKLHGITAGDGGLLVQFRKQISDFQLSYQQKSGLKDRCMADILDLFWLFPALVLPLEVREDSGLVAESLASPHDFAIGRMLLQLAKISEGLEPKWYVRGFVLSMCESANDLMNGIKLTEKTLGQQSLPVVPLFETENALQKGHEILKEVYAKRSKLITLHEKKWGGRFEVMLGYSDSSKESGVFPSRLLISQAIKKLDKVIKEHKLTPVFFHGSGGSVERGGGSIQEQTQWWPQSAIKTFKATYQGETVARTFATPQIFAGTIQKIADEWDRKRSLNLSKDSKRILDAFSKGIQQSYQESVADPGFLEAVEKASPYLFLSHLNIGSRPSKRSSKLQVGGLRAIPWILCWTQTRVLFPTWWGVGRTWESFDKIQKDQLRKAYAESNLLVSFVKLLGFTLDKVEMAVWRLYLEESSLPREQVDLIFDQFLEEFDLTLKFHRQISGEKNLLWHRPWLKESIALRSPMIHPLNLLQLMAVKEKDGSLLRKTVTGISCGMLTTG